MHFLEKRGLQRLGQGGFVCFLKERVPNLCTWRAIRLVSCRQGVQQPVTWGRDSSAKTSADVWL